MLNAFHTVSHCFLLDCCSSTYKIVVCPDDPFTAIYDEVKKQAGSQCRVEEMWGVHKQSGEKITFDASKTVEENGITPTKAPILRFPSAFA